MSEDDAVLLGVECALPAGYPCPADGRPQGGRERGGYRAAYGATADGVRLPGQASPQRAAPTILPSTSSIA